MSMYTTAKVQRLKAAIAKQQRIRFLYDSPSAEMFRIVDPWVVTLAMGWPEQWYLDGFDLARNAPRRFSLKKIKEIDTLQEVPFIDVEEFDLASCSD